ncbi:MAG: hypothetical protein V3V20_02135 [Algisphaera sp.]
MNKQELIDAIHAKNPTAAKVFLEMFDESTLDRYSRRLNTIAGHRGPDSGWVREGSTPAITNQADLAA